MDSKESYVDVWTNGDLTTLTWVEDPTGHQQHTVRYTGLNDVDLQIAGGQLPDTERWGTKKRVNS